MGKALLIAGCLASLLLFAATSRSDVGTETSPTTTQPAGRDGTGTGPNSHGHRHGPTEAPPTTADSPPVTNMPPTQTDPGPASAVWTQEQLTPSEQAYVARAANNAGWDQTNAAFAHAVAEQTNAAAANAAANQLGADDLASQGVVP